MKTRNERNDASTRSKQDAAAPKRRFRIEKLEERIAPKKGGKGTHNCGGGSGYTDYGSASIY